MLVNVTSRGEWGIPRSALEGTQHGEERGDGGRRQGGLGVEWVTALTDREDAWGSDGPAHLGYVVPELDRSGAGNQAQVCLL